MEKLELDLFICFVQVLTISFFLVLRNTILTNSSTKIILFFLYSIHPNKDVLNTLFYKINKNKNRGESLRV